MRAQTQNLCRLHAMLIGSALHWLFAWWTPRNFVHSICAVVPRKWNLVCIDSFRSVYGVLTTVVCCFSLMLHACYVYLIRAEPDRFYFREKRYRAKRRHTLRLDKKNCQGLPAEWWSTTVQRLQRKSVLNIPMWKFTSHMCVNKYIQVFIVMDLFG